MIFIGNDIVHLKHPANSGVNPSERYLSKSYTQAEQQSIMTSIKIIPELWKFWSCKEAAFKTLQKMGVVSFYEPKNIEVVSSNREVGSPNFFGIVTYENHIIYTHSYIQDDFILTLGCNCKDGLASSIWSIESCSDYDESRRVRESLLNILGTTVSNYSIEDIKKNEQNIPFLGGLSSIDISLSHDYGLVSAAYLHR